LKQEKKAKTSLIWFVLNFFSLGITLWIPLIVWYFASAKGQIKYVEEKYGKTGYKKKSQLIPFVAMIATYLILILIFVAISMGGAPKAMAQEVGLAASTWSKLQQVYILENERIGNCQKIGYTPPNSEFFTYQCGIEGSYAVLAISNKVNLGDCKAGNVWAVAMNKNTEIEAKQPEDKNCVKLSPKFCDIATSKKCDN